MPAFLIPSVFGDEPQLQDLRRRLHGWVDFDVLALPDAGARGALLTDMAATGRFLVDEISRRRPVGSIALIGYSFGASMALEVAAQLTEAGRRVTFLGALDGPFQPPGFAGHSADDFCAAPRRLVKSIVVDAAVSMDTVRRLAIGAAPTGSFVGGRAEPMRRALLWHLRNKALKAWVPRGCNAPGIHVSTGTYGPTNLARWAALCPNLRFLEVHASHEHLLKGTALDAVVTALAAQVALHRDCDSLASCG